MPVNFDALLRYHTIDKCLQNRFRNWTWEDLAEKCTEAILEASTRPNKNTISQRTIENDIRIMRSDLLGYNAPIVRKKGNYYYDDKNFSIRNATITDQDIANLGAAIKMFKAYRGLDFFHEIESLVNKLEKKVHLKTYQQVQQIISFEHLPASTGEQWINSLIKAITNKQVIRLTHKKFSRSQERSYTIHPYFLKEYRNRWYILGWYPDENYIKTFALDRVITIEPLPAEEYKEANKPDPETYFKNTIGISLPNTEPELIQLRFNGDIPAYIKSQPIHASQELVDESPDALVINLSLVVNHELESLILSYAENVQVILPSHLAERIQKRHKKASDSYSTNRSKISIGTSKNRVSS